MSELTASPMPLGLRRVPLRTLGDERLARFAARGDKQAFAAIYERYHQPLYRYCHSIVGNAEDAADALQATMTAALRALPGERREIALKGWLYRVAHNESISIVRRRRPEAELQEVASVATAGPEVDAARRERLAHLVADLGELPDRQRGALVMRELNGLDYGEIASAFGISAAAAKQAVYHARTALHELTEGREMDCETATRALSEGDGRTRRSRKLRAHLRHCQSCADFRAAIGSRQADLSALAPPLPAAAATGLLSGILGGGGGGAGGGGLLSMLVAGAGKLATGGGVLGLSAAGAVAVVLGAGVPAVSGGEPEHDRRAHGDPVARMAASGHRSDRPRASDVQHRKRTKFRRDRPSDRRARAPRSDAAPSRGGIERQPSPGGSPVSAPPAQDRSVGPPGVGGRASEPGREQARRHAPAGLPAPAQQRLGGDGQASLPRGGIPPGIPVPAPRIPTNLPIPHR